MSSSPVNPAQSGIRIVVSDPELAKKIINEQVDKGIDKVGEVSKELLKKGINELPNVAPYAATIIKTAVDSGMIIATHQVPSITPIAVSITNSLVDKSVVSSAEYSVQVSTPLVDPSVDSSTNLSKQVTHQSVDKSVESTVSSISSFDCIKEPFKG